MNLWLRTGIGKVAGSTTVVTLVVWFLGRRGRKGGIRLACTARGRSLRSRGRGETSSKRTGYYLVILSASDVSGTYLSFLSRDTS